MAKSRRPRRNDKPTTDLTALFAELRANFSKEGLGLVFFLLGGYFGFAFLSSTDGVSWIERMLGSTAFLAIIGLLLLGAVLMLGERAGYWNPQAIVGGELLLLGLAAFAFVQENAAVDWTPPADGSSGGLLGWGVGSLFVALLGRWPGGLVALILAGAGLYLLIRHTPLIYAVGYAQRWLTPLGLLTYFGISQPSTARQTSGERLPPTLPALPDPTPVQNPLPPMPEAPKPEKPKRAAIPKRPTPTPAANKLQPVRSTGNLPPTDFLTEDSGQYGSRDTAEVGKLIEETLADFDIPVQVVNVESGPTVTQFGVKPLYIVRGGQQRKVRVSRIVNLADDLALALAAPAVRIEAPVPGYPYVGIEVPNTTKIDVGMRGILESALMQSKGGVLPLALGRDTAGAPVISDLTRAPHLLIAGSTGSGKSVCINAIIVSLLMHHGPESLRFVMVDPKMVELPGYNGIPHMIGSAITEVDQVTGALAWLLLQMDDRYQTFRELKVRNIASYNELAAKQKELPPLPYLVLVVDELADLMMTAPEEIERQLVRLAQMARAVGIHLILATQRPSVDVVTGLIKANFPTRIAFAVTSQIDSRVILDTPGAERLLGRGDMLFMRPDSAKLARVQGCWVSDNEIQKVVQFWKKREAEENPDGPKVKVAPWLGLMDRMEDEDELILDAIDAIRGQETCSTSFVQRKLGIGYPKAARLMEQLESKGVVGPDLGGGRGREVLLKEEEEDDGEEGLFG
jgi:S-DNA-T family DNA segregation ATPase FtsK/SpoIIIE